MTDSDRKIYLDLYDIARRNMRHNGIVMRFGKPLLLQRIKSVNDCFDPEEMEGLSCHDFIFACYLRLLGRLPELSLRTYPGPEDVVPGGCDSDFVKRVLPEFLKSQEFRTCHAVEDRPPPPSSVPPPPPPPPRFMSERTWTRIRAVLKPITPFFLRRMLNAPFRHD